MYHCMLKDRLGRYASRYSGTVQIVLCEVFRYSQTELFIVSRVLSTESASLLSIPNDLNKPRYKRSRALLKSRRELWLYNPHLVNNVVPVCHIPNDLNKPRYKRSRALLKSRRELWLYNPHLVNNVVPA
ncbi:hypothetical protein J6590_081136 [Homalodisca vitripennis]|nr:hypothetical protein J6590_081136 [Homalodisca vitripennis]